MTRGIWVLLGCMGVLSGPAVASEFPGASGMAPLNERAYLCVQDAKDRPDNLGADRFGALIVFTEKERAQYGGNLPMLSYTPLSWSYSQNMPPNSPFPSDLEALCAISGRSGEFLACESGYWEGKYGRLFHLKVNAGENETWSVLVERAVQLPKLNGEVEGIACAAATDGRLLLILSERGGAVPYWSGRLLTYWLDLAGGEMIRVGNEPAADAAEFVMPRFGLENHPVGMRNSLFHPRGRAISDLYLDPMGQLWGAAAADNGDAGPFTSYVFRLGMVDAQSGRIETLMGSDPLWTVEGLKIEALSGPPTSAVSGAVLSFATDDEGYGGIWRPLGPATASGYGGYF